MKKKFDMSKFQIMDTYLEVEKLFDKAVGRLAESERMRFAGDGAFIFGTFHRLINRAQEEALLMCGELANSRGVEASLLKEIARLEQANRSKLGAAVAKAELERQEKEGEKVLVEAGNIAIVEKKETVADKKKGRGREKSVRERGDKKRRY